ncbi:sensor histidine kinase [Allokutzneria sp. A3M-2-11 16]|uniref:sensor histidine kinase n=1 Tax=Allokutzneria sp. A3M-2-11 16 TaxID=2962043 RepID=UPI0020B815EE|nr:sensor histidine kinase [Allokutzneria sp. A3M-2-11 16]MCP3801143.1 sensor histidine kinase [Allokutzneria sp. A3M-2-11 16]
MLANRVRQFVARHPLALDLLAPVLLTAIGAAMMPAKYGADALPWIFQFVLVLPLLWWRRAPVTVFAITTALVGTQWALGFSVVGELAVYFAYYSVMLRRPSREASIATAVVVVGILVQSLFGIVVPRFLGIPPVGMATMAGLIGLTLRNQRAYRASMREREARQAELAVAAERTRIAREIHDIVAHSLGVMISLADGATTVARADPQKALGAMEAVSSTGRGALGELRRVLGVLRAEHQQDDQFPQPGISALGELVEKTRAAGLPVTYALEGHPDNMPASAQVAVYRIVQEALTNTMKHADGCAAVRVEVRLSDSGAEIVVSDTGGVDLAPRQAGSGHGLVGMRERVAVFGGSFSAGPREGGGWLMSARVPVSPA